MMMGKKLLRWWNEPEASDGESAKKMAKLLYSHIAHVHALFLLHNSHIMLLLLCNINEAFWLSWISLVCTLVAAIGGIVGFKVHLFNIFIYYCIMYF